MTLLDGSIGDVFLVNYIDIQEKVKKRLEILGLTKGTQVKILNNKRSGSTIIKLRGTRYAIGKEIAFAIKVRRKENE
ncbi:MAG: ferrous iron transport protein A [Clostridiales bacterium]|nr:ferrous iron transport protein A [Clostridiales bacterium]